MHKSNGGNIQPTVDEQVTAYRWIIASLPNADDAARNLSLQGRRTGAVKQVIEALALELHKKIVSALGAGDAGAAPVAPVLDFGSKVVCLDTHRERGRA